MWIIFKKVCSNPSLIAANDWVSKKALQLEKQDATTVTSANLWRDADPSRTPLLTVELEATGDRKEWQSASGREGQRKCPHCFRRWVETRADRWAHEDWPAYIQLSAGAHLAPAELIRQEGERTTGYPNTAWCARTAACWATLTSDTQQEQRTWGHEND